MLALPLSLLQEFPLACCEKVKITICVTKLLFLPGR